MKAITCFLVLVFALFLVSCSQEPETEGLEPITGDLIQEPGTVITTEKLDCSNKDSLTQRIDEKQDRINQYEDELTELNAKLLLYIETSNYTEIEKIKFTVEKTLRLHNNEKKNRAALIEGLSKCK